MDNSEISPIETTPPSPGEPVASVRSLKELIDKVSGRGFHPVEAEDSGIAEALPFPFLALVGQREMKLALLLTLVNPTVGGVLLIGPRGTGKTTGVRSLVDLLPEVPRSMCYYGCLPEDIETGGIDAVCPDCAKKYAEGQPLSRPDRVRLVELPLNARIEDVIGGVDERAVTNDRLRLRRGLLSQADSNLLFVDEINLLADEIVDALLDAAAQGSYTVRRGPLSATYRARFVLIGSMNPEEGRLRPQIMDRFGLRVVVHGLDEPQERLEAYRRVQAYLQSPRKVIAAFGAETDTARLEIQAARQLLPTVTLPEEVAQHGMRLVERLQIDSLRAEITLFECARAFSAIDGRVEVSLDDLREIAPMALRLRKSSFMAEYFAQQQAEETELFDTIGSILK
jgi:magnesium chelatase subunit I